MPSRDASRPTGRQGPLKPLHFLMLVSLSEAERHPYGLKKDLEAREPGRLRLGAGGPSIEPSSNCSTPGSSRIRV